MVIHEYYKLIQTQTIYIYIYTGEIAESIGSISRRRVTQFE